MKKTNIKILILVLVLVLALQVVMFTACNKKGGDKGPSQEEIRQTQIVELNKNLLFLSCPAQWKSDMSKDEFYDIDNSELARWSDSADYILSKQSMIFFGDIFFASDLQTAQIEGLNKSIEQNQDLFKPNQDGEYEVSAILEVFDDLGFTEIDIANLFYDIVLAVMTDFDTVFKSANQKIDDVLSVAYDVTVLDALNGARLENSALNQSYNSYYQSDEQIESTMISAKGGIDSIVAFLMTVSDLTLSNGILDAFDGGVLGEINDQELKVYVDSVVSSLSEVETEFEVPNVQNLENALRLMIDKLSSIDTNNIFVQSVKDYADIFMNIFHFVPCIIDGIDLLGDSITLQTLDMIRVFQDKSNDEIDVFSNFAKFLLVVLEKDNSALKGSLLDAIDRVRESVVSVDDAANYLPFYVASGAINTMYKYSENVYQGMSDEIYKKVMSFTIGNAQDNALTEMDKEYIFDNFDLVAQDLEDYFDFFFSDEAHQLLAEVAEWKGEYNDEFESKISALGLHIILQIK